MSEVATLASLLRGLAKTPFKGESKTTFLERGFFVVAVAEPHAVIVTTGDQAFGVDTGADDIVNWIGILVGKLGTEKDTHALQILATVVDIDRLRSIPFYPQVLPGIGRNSPGGILRARCQLSFINVDTTVYFVEVTIPAIPEHETEATG